MQGGQAQTQSQTAAADNSHFNWKDKQQMETEAHMQAGRQDATAVEQRHLTGTG